jgi:hypothetical protein
MNCKSVWSNDIDYGSIMLNGLGNNLYTFMNYEQRMSEVKSNETAAVIHYIQLANKLLSHAEAQIMDTKEKEWYVGD